MMGAIGRLRTPRNRPNHAAANHWNLTRRRSVQFTTHVLARDLVEAYRVFARRFSCLRERVNEKVIPSDLANGRAIEPVMVRIQGTWFWMGCETGRDDEKPPHRVWVDTFELAAFQVTNEEYACFLSTTGGPPPSCWNDPNFNHPKMPVVAISWYEAVSYCDWLSRATSKRYRLPSEAEWERAARADTERSLYPWGDQPPELLPDYALRWKSGPEPIGLYPPNAYGLYNLGDNVHEWCADWYDASYYRCSPTRNPQGPANGSRRASRGGSWRHHVKASRTAARSSIPPEFKYTDYGFRVARSSIS